MKTYLYRFNSFRNLYFDYYVDEEDLVKRQFDESLHDNAKIPDMSSPLQCGYCQTIFESRNQLFHHLNFMNIDTRRIKSMIDDSKPSVKDEHLGDSGLYLGPRYKIHKKVKKFNGQHKHNRYQVEYLSQALSNIILSPSIREVQQDETPMMIDC